MIKTIGIVSFCAVLLCACSQDADDKAAKATKDLVNRAADLIEEKRRRAFDDLAQGEWYQGNQYVFVIKDDGEMQVHPARPELVGKNQMDLRDVTGTFIIRDFIKQLEDRSSAWVEYRWVQPEMDQACNKHSYIKKVVLPRGTYIVGSGYCKTSP